jgi:YHS domain-containing protein
MRSIRSSVVAVALAVGLAAAVSAGDTGSKKPAETPKELKPQTHCPVMGGKIDSTLYTDIQGQRVYHCCPMCSAKMKADPEKYFKKAADEGVLFENIQTTCPVSGEKLDEKTVYADYVGRRVYFCCKKCREKFNADPQKYLMKLDEKADATTSTPMDDMKHEDHDCGQH